MPEPVESEDIGCFLSEIVESADIVVCIVVIVVNGVGIVNEVVIEVVDCEVEDLIIEVVD